MNKAKILATKATCVPRKTCRLQSILNWLGWRKTAYKKCSMLFSENACSSIIEHIASEMQKKLISYLKNRDIPFSVGLLVAIVLLVLVNVNGHNDKTVS